MYRRFCLFLLILLAAFFSYSAFSWADDEGQDDLDRATDAKLNVKTFSDLDEVVRLLDSAQKKGLSEANQVFAKGLLLSTLLQRASARAELIARNPPIPGLDARLKELRKDALDDLNRVLQLDPKQIQALLLIAKLERLPGGDVKRSDEALQQVIESGRKNPENTDVLAQALLLQATIDPDPQKKIAALDEAVKVAPGNVEAVRMRGLLRAEMGKLDEALRDLDKAIELEPKNTANYEYKSLVLIQMKKYDEARACLDQAQLIEPKSTFLLMQKARIYALQANLQEAMRVLDEARKLEPTNVAVVLLHATLVEDPEKKEADLDEAARLAPKNALVWRTRGLYHTEQKKFDAALADFDKIIALEPKDLSSYEAKAAIHMEMKKYTEALADIDKAVEQEPQSTSLQRLRAEVLAGAEKFDEALAILEKLRQADPKDEVTQLQIAMLYGNQHKTDKAIDLYTALLEKNPEQWMALRGRGDLLLNVGKHAEAIADYEKALKLHPDDSGIENNLAWVLATSPEEKLRDGKRAVVLATSACETTEYKAAYILSTLAAAYAESGDMPSALKWSAKALELGPEDQKKSLEKELETYKAGKPFRELMKDGKPVELDAAKKEPEKKAPEKTEPEKKEPEKKEAGKTEPDIRAVQQQLGFMKTSLNIYKLIHNSYPDKLEFLWQRPAGMNTQDWQGPFVENQNSLVDVWKHPFRYQILRGGLDCKVTSAGPDGSFDTSDDISCTYIDDGSGLFEPPMK
jgi:tetratricopeptide (TPR) repeat protein